LADEVEYARAHDIPIIDGIPQHLVGMKAFFRGCGNASFKTIESAAKAGVKVHGIAELGALIISDDKNGFKPEDARELYQVSTMNQLPDGTRLRSIAEWARWKIGKDPDRRIRIYYEDQTGDRDQRERDTVRVVESYWQEEKPERMIEAAVERTINARNAYLVPDGCKIIELGNGPITPQAAIILKSRHIDWIPGILANAAGVDVSLFECIRNILNIRELRTKDIERSVTELMSKNIKAVYDLRRAIRKMLEERDGSNIMMSTLENLSTEELYYALAIAKSVKMKSGLEERVSQDRRLGTIPHSLTLFRS
jgi:glutamate dehydrogenase/leucine dehydrogenase